MMVIKLKWIIHLTAFYPELSAAPRGLLHFTELLSQWQASVRTAEADELNVFIPLLQQGRVYKIMSALRNAAMIRMISDL